jgi:hypothetical protein
VYLDEEELNLVENVCVLKKTSLDEEPLNPMEKVWT